MEFGFIHPTAVIHPSARLSAQVRVGPHAVIDADVELGEGCEVGPQVYLTGHTSIGPGNRFHAGCVIGDTPQDFKYREASTRLEIGARNIFREHVTVHRSNRLDEATVIGDGNFFMAGSHIGHNCRVGRDNIFANGALLGGHVEVDRQAFISGNCLVHQFCRIGRLSLMQGGSAISKDLPPFCIARGDNHICGLNTIGLRRAGVASADRLVLRRAYRSVFRSGQRLKVAAEQLALDFPDHGLVAEWTQFIRATKRGLCADILFRDGEPQSTEEA